LSQIETGNSMQLGGIIGATLRQNNLPARSGDSGQSATQSRALVALSPGAAGREPPVTCYQAAFLAHLIAMKDCQPQTRERRRAEPNEAHAAYRATAALTGRG
jgi:hypothetical protein